MYGWLDFYKQLFTKRHVINQSHNKNNLYAKITAEYELTDTINSVAKFVFRSYLIISHVV